MVRKITFFVLAFILVFASIGFSTVTCTPTKQSFARADGVKYGSVTITCSGTTGTYTFAGDALFAVGKTLMSVEAYGGSTLPDAADVMLTVNGLDLLGGKGVNLIPASTTPSECLPYNAFNGLYRFKRMLSAPTLTISNQGTSGADMIFVIHVEE